MIRIQIIFRAIDINGLIGNIGGYIGLCLGYSILQIPEFFTLLITNLKRNVKSLRAKKDLVKDDIVCVNQKEWSAETSNDFIKESFFSENFRDLRCLQGEVKELKLKLNLLTKSVENLIQRQTN